MTSGIVLHDSSSVFLSNIDVQGGDIGVELILSRDIHLSDSSFSSRCAVSGDRVQGFTAVNILHGDALSHGKPTFLEASIRRAIRGYV